MLIKRLKLNNYRNYKTAVFDFDPNLNIIIGKNGVGKTNILESLIVVSNTKSFRTNNDQSLIKEGEDYLKIEVINEDGVYKVVINDKAKSLFLNSDIFKKTSEYIGKINCILFKPSDIELYNQSPKERRKLLDIELGKLSNSYLQSLLKYNSLLKDKNKLLKEENVDKNYLNTINEMMIPEMENIITQREDFFNYINNQISNIYSRISNEEKKLSIKYKKCSEKELLNEMLNNSFSKDILYRYATEGIHLEDYEFYLDDKEISEIASQGQKRLTIISFKLAIVNYVNEKINNTPIILLDDVLSELDKENKTRLINYLPNGAQIIVTNTDISNVEINRRYKLINLEEGGEHV